MRASGDVVNGPKDTPEATERRTAARRGSGRTPHMAKMTMTDLLIVALLLGAHFFGTSSLHNAGAGLAFLWCCVRIVSKFGAWIFKMLTQDVPQATVLTMKEEL